MKQYFAVIYIQMRQTFQKGCFPGMDIQIRYQGILECLEGLTPRHYALTGQERHPHASRMKYWRISLDSLLWSKRGP